MSKLRDVRFRKTDLTKTGQLEFDQQMLTLLSAINESKTLLQVAKETKMEAAEFKKNLLKLYKLGLVEEVKTKVEYMEKAYLEEIRDALVDLLGPLGEVLLQDAADKLDTELPYIPKIAVEEFIVAILDEIPGDKQKKTFKEKMDSKIPDMMK